MKTTEIRDKKEALMAQERAIFDAAQAEDERSFTPEELEKI